MELGSRSRWRNISFGNLCVWFCSWQLCFFHGSSSYIRLSTSWYNGQLVFIEISMLAMAIYFFRCVCWLAIKGVNISTLLVLVCFYCVSSAKTDVVYPLSNLVNVSSPFFNSVDDSIRLDLVLCCVCSCPHYLRFNLGRLVYTSTIVFCITSLGHA